MVGQVREEAVAETSFLAPARQVKAIGEWEGEDALAQFRWMLKRYRRWKNASLDSFRARESESALRLAIKDRAAEENDLLLGLAIIETEASLHKLSPKGRLVFPDEIIKSTADFLSQTFRPTWEMKIRALANFISGRREEGVRFWGRSSRVYQHLLCRLWQSWENQCLFQRQS